MGVRIRLACLLVFVALALFAYAGTAHASVTLYSQLDDSGEMTNPQPTFQNAHIDSASLGTLYLGKGPLVLTFSMQSPSADPSNQPEGVALGSCASCTDLQTYLFTDADRTLLADGQFHTFRVTTGSTTIGLADGTNPVYFTFFNLPQYQYQTHVKSNAALTIPYLLIEADDYPPPIVPPTIPADGTTIYTQPDDSGVMTNPQPTFQNAHIDSASLGNLPLGQGPLYLIFSLQDPNVGATPGAPLGVCLEPAGTTACNEPLQTYTFTDADRALLADQASHAFLVKTGSTTSTYADGTQPVAISFFGLTQLQGQTKVKSNAAATIPAVTIALAGPPGTTTPTGASSVLFIPATEASRLYMSGSFGIERQLWEPPAASNIPELILNADGTSVNTVYTKDIIGDLYDNMALGGVVGGALDDDAKVYGDFKRFMDSLVASTTLGVREWRAYPYDWRFDPRDIIANGTLTKMPDGSLKRVYLATVLDEMASSSATGKVTIVTHSNGGLVAKALLQKLEAEEKAGKVDRLIFIGTPQWGTPVDIGAMLHGDGQNRLLGLITYAPEVRLAASTMPGPHALLPSSEYFAHVGEAVAHFKNSGMAKPFHDRFPNGIRSWSELAAFASDAYGLNALVTDPDVLDRPLALSPTLLAKAKATHDALDSWTPPPGLEVTSIAGWGQLTVYGYDYSQKVGHTFCLNIFEGFNCTTKPQFVHTPKVTEDGDDTVVSPSATGGGGDVWYFDAQRFSTDKGIKIIHQDLLAATSIQASILSLLVGREVGDSYFSTTNPSSGKHPLTIIGAESPVNLLVTDEEGNETGLVPIEGLDGLYFKKQGIPGSAVEVSGENKFVILPAGATYSLVATGYAEGPATLFIESLDADGFVVASTTITDIPVATSTTINLSVDASGIPSVASIDFDGDGASDATLAPVAGASSTLDPLSYISYMQGIVATMPLDPKVAKQISVKLANVEHMIVGDGEWEEGDTDTFSMRVGKKVDQVASYINKAGIAPDLAADILAMLTALRSLTFGL